VAEGRQTIDIYQRALIAGKPFDLVILELTIPGGMSGLEVARNIRRIDPDARLVAPVVTQMIRLW